MRKPTDCLPILSIILAAMVFLQSGLVYAKEELTLAATEVPPYIGEHLTGQGYVYELVDEVFRQVGYRPSFHLFPLAKAAHLAKEGQVDAYLPAHLGMVSSESLAYSAPFPGDRIGLLKKKSLRVEPSVLAIEKPSGLLKSLQKYRFGVVSGMLVSEEFDGANYLEKQSVGDNLESLDLLDQGQIHFAVIDKYSAADLMTNHRPHLIGQLEFLPLLLAEKPFHVAFSTRRGDHRQVLEDFNRGLSVLEHNGRLREIMEGHGFFLPRKQTKGKRKLVIGVAATDETAVMKKLSGKFEKLNPDIELEWRVLDENTLRTRLLSDLAISDGQFDVMMIGAYEAAIWSRNRWILPLGNLDAAYNLSDIVAPVKESLSYDGQLYALPFYAESTMTFYRADLFEEAGLAMPEKPGYLDLYRLAKALHDPDKGVYGIGLRGKPGWGQNMAFLTTMVNSYGGRWFNLDWEPQINSPEWREALSLYRELLTRYGPPEPWEKGWQENLALFESGQLGIVVDATSFAGRIYNSSLSQVSDRTGYASAPSDRFPAGSRWLWSWGLAIPASSRSPEDALRFIAWATSEAYIRQVAEAEGWIAVPPGSRYSTYGAEYREVAGFAEFVIGEIEQSSTIRFSEKPVPYHGPQFVSIPEFPAIGNQVGEILGRYLRGDLSLNQALEDAQNQTRLIMKRSGY